MTNAFLPPPAFSRRRLLQLAGGTSLGAATGLLTAPAQAAVRVDIERYVRWLQDVGHYQPSTVSRRLLISAS